MKCFVSSQLGEDGFPTAFKSKESLIEAIKEWCEESECSDVKSFTVRIVEITNKQYSELPEI
jgi:hypothetical protein